jgi:hypothetical protein
MNGAGCIHRWIPALGQTIPEFVRTNTMELL